MTPLLTSPRASLPPLLLLALALAVPLFAGALQRRGSHAAVGPAAGVVGRETVRCSGRVSLGTSRFSTKFCLTYTGRRGNTAADDAEAECGVFTIVERDDRPGGHDRYCKLEPSAYLDCNEARMVDSGLHYNSRSHVLSAEGHTGAQVRTYLDRDWVFFDPDGTHDFPLRVYCDRGSVVPQIVKKKGGPTRVQ